MPISAPEKVATSPNATRSDSWICPCGEMNVPQKRRTSPPKERMAAVISWILTFIMQFFRCRMLLIKKRPAPDSCSAFPNRSTTFLTEYILHHASVEKISR